MTDNFDKLKKLRASSKVELLDNSAEPLMPISASENKTAPSISLPRFFLKKSPLNKSQALIFTLVCLVLFLISQAIFSYFDIEQAKKPRIWPDYKLTSFGKTSVRLKTSYKDSHVYYHLLIEPVTKKLSTAIAKNPFETNKGFGLELYDKDGFKTYSNQMSLGDFTAIVDDNGKIQAYDINSTFPLTLAAYKSINRFDMTYHLGD